MRAFAHIILIVALACGGTLLAALGWKHYNQAKAPAKLAAAEQKVDTAKADLIAKAKEDVHKGNVALDAAPDSRQKQVAQLFFHEGQGILDDATGAPSAADLAAWSDLVNRLMSENATIRAQAETEQTQHEAIVKDLSGQLTTARAGLARAEADYRQKADEGLRLLAWLHKAEWIIGSLIGLYVLGRVLMGLGQKSPLFAGVGAVVNGIVAPELQKGYARAQQGLSSVGTALGTIRAKLPEVAKQIVPFFNGVMDAEHQRVIGKAAAEAHQQILAKEAE